MLLSFTPCELICAPSTWQGASSNWNLAGNWTSGVPSSGDRATFNNGGNTTITFSSNSTVGELLFTSVPDAQAYTFNITHPRRFIIDGTGITNNSGNTQTFNLTGNNPRLTFENNVIISGGGTTSINNDATGNGAVNFVDNSSAGNSTITNNNNLNFNNSSTAGNSTIANNDNLNFNNNSDAGSATITNTGTVDFDSNATASGATIDNQLGGTIDIAGSSSGVSIGSVSGAGNITLGNNNTLTLGALNVANETISGVISGGVGSDLIKTGTGNLTLTGANNYPGGTTITDGTLTGTTTSLTGDILDNAALVFDQGFDGTFAGNISGTGSLTKLSGGNVTLSGNSIYTGNTNITGGTLTNNGSLTSPVIVNAGGTYRGTGSTTGALTNNGIVAPGSDAAIGTLTSGNYTGAGNLNIRLAPAGGSDVLAINGTATLANTNLRVSTLGFTDKTFTILTATGGFGGTRFNTLTLSPGLIASIKYSPNIVQIISWGNGFAALLPGKGGNALIIAQYLDQIIAVKTESDDLIEVLIALSDAARQGTLCAALNQISPDPYRELGFLSFDQANLVNQSINTQQQRILDRVAIKALALDNVPSTSLTSFQKHLNTRNFRGRIEPIRPLPQNALRPQKGVPQLNRALSFNEDNLPVRKSVQAGHSSVWIEPYGQTGTKKNSSQGNSSPLVGAKSNTYGMTVGGDTKVAPNTYLGVLGGVMNTHFDWTQNRGKGRVSGYYGGVYALWLNKPGFYVDGQVVLGGERYSTTRRINFQTINRTARQSHLGLSVSTDVEVGYLWTFDKTVVQPFFNYAYIAIHENSFREKGANSLNIHSPSKTAHFSRSELGPILSHFFVCGETLIYPSLKLSWVQKRPLGNKAKGVKFNFTDQSFGTTVFGDNRVRNLISPAISLTAQFKEGLYVTGDLNGEFGSKEKLGQAMLTLGYNF